MTSALRRGVIALAFVLSAGLQAGCDTRAQFAPSLTRVVGLQVDGESLQILTGTPCAEVDRIVMTFSGGADDQIPRTQIVAEPSVTVDEVSIGAEVVAAGFVTTEALPADFDWRDYSEMDVSLSGPGGELGGATSDLEPVKAQGAKHAGDGTAYVRDEGWLTPQEVIAGNAESFLTACAPDPARKSG